MQTINQTKELAQADTPLLFFQCVLPSGDVEYWSTHSIALNGSAYSARILKHNLFDLQLSADDAMDGISQLSIVLANADSAMSELNRAVGFKGSSLTVFFAFADLPTLTITTESSVLFRGIAGDPEHVTEDSLQLSFTNKLTLQRIPVPEVRVQSSCPWSFPANLGQRTEALNGGANGRFSRFYRCGYSADVPGGVGNLNNGVAFTTCDGSRTQCQQRGMFSKDSAGNTTQRFGGFEFVPSSILVRTSGAKTSHLSAVLDNSAKFNDPVPIVYGTGWLKAPVILARNDGNLTHMEVLLGMGVIQGILKVVVNDIEIPQAAASPDVTATGWYGTVTTGTRSGNFNLDFRDANGNPLGDPYGSVAVLSVVVPNRISNGKSLPIVEVLLEGMQIDVYNLDGSFQQSGFTNNPVWVILDILRRCGWSTSDLNLTSFALAAQSCQTLISTTDLNGNAVQVPRYQCNLILTTRQSAASIVRGIRVSSSLMLRYGATGLLELVPETALATQQPTLPDGSNSTELLANGWPAYEFSDASAPFSGIVRNANGSSSLVLSSRTIAETSNRLSVEFQDSSNEYQQDSLSLVDSVDASLIGYEISSQSTALGVANMSQATRVLLRQLDKSTKGNLFVQFQTSFRALKIRPGDIIAITYLKEGLIRTLFRVTKLSPSTNYQLVTILAQIHNDDWYSDNPAVLAGAGRQPLSQVNTPFPLIGLEAHLDSNNNLEFFDFEVQEQIQAQKDGSATDTLTVWFAQPTKPTSNSPALPLVSLSPQYSVTGGTLKGGSKFYYAVSVVDQVGKEGALSFTVPAVIPSGTDTNCVSITGLSFPVSATAFNVYRGTTPQLLYRITSSNPLTATFTDTGFPFLPIGPPDASFDHANFYYRFEYAGPYVASGYSTTTIACADMGAVVQAYRGMSVRIIEGTGRGQERSITSNDQTQLTVATAWTTIPDSTSSFVICEPSWRFAAVAPSSPLQFEISYQSGSVIQISGRSANVNNLESSADLCPLTRLALGGGRPDAGTPAPPDFTLTAPGGGELTISQVGFADLTNTSSITSGTLELFYWNELLSPSSFQLSSPVDGSSGSISLVSVGQPSVGQIIQIGAELMTVLSVNTGTNQYQVARGSLGSPASLHSAGDSIFHLQSSTLIVPFGLNFFENRASLNFLHTVDLPDVRVCGAQFFVTNAFGDSQATQQSYLALTEMGLRTLSGGQFSLQLSGTVATQQNAAPPLFIQATHAVRDIRASLNQPASGFSIAVDVLQNGVVYGSVAISSANTISNVLDGVSLPPLTEGATLSLNITLNAIANFQGSLNPGRDLTVTIRF